MSLRLLHVIFILAYGLALGIYWSTASQIPDPVAARFGGGGIAVGYMARTTYFALMLGLTVLLPLLLLGAISWLPRWLPQCVNLPHRDHWLSPSRRSGTLATLDRAGCVMATTTALFMASMHWMIAQANASQPPRLAYGPFMASTALFVVLSVAFAIFMARRFRRLPGSA